ncbi:MAG: methylase [Succinivibrio sp.]|nr:methylase [Succinivibrio sp.]
MRIVAGRLKSDYSYSPAVYNNFVIPELTDQQKEQISKTAQAILDARALYPDSSLADLYDPLTMPPELLKAHKANDKAVLALYGFKPDATEEEIVSRLMQMYAEKAS